MFLIGLCNRFFLEIDARLITHFPDQVPHAINFKIECVQCE